MAAQRHSEGRAGGAYGSGGHDALQERHRLRLHHRHQQPDGVQQGRNDMDDVQLLR